METPAPATQPPSKPRGGWTKWEWLLIPAIVFGVLMLAFLLTGPKTPTINHISFNAETWRANPVVDRDAMTLGTIRQSMVDDLVNQRLLIGKTRREVEDLLGPPEPYPSPAYVYLLGSERSSLAMDAEALHIYFENGCVTKVQILSH